MEHTFGHGFVKGRGGFPEKGAGRLGVLLPDGPLEFFDNGVGPMQDGVVARMALLRLAGPFDD